MRRDLSVKRVLKMGCWGLALTFGSMTAGGTAYAQSELFQQANPGASTSSGIGSSPSTGFSGSQVPGADTSAPSSSLGSQVGGSQAGQAAGQVGQPGTVPGTEVMQAAPGSFATTPGTLGTSPGTLGSSQGVGISPSTGDTTGSGTYGSTADSQAGSAGIAGSTSSSSVNPGAPGVVQGIPAPATIAPGTTTNR